MEAIAVCTLGAAGDPLWANSEELLLSSGNGLYAQNIVSGAQRHLWINSSNALGGLAGPLVHTVCHTQNIIAYAHSGPSPCITISSCQDFATLANIKASKDSQFVHLALSYDGTCLAATTSFPEHSLEWWRLPELATGGSSSPAGPPSQPAVWPPAPPEQCLAFEHSSLRCVARCALGPHLLGLPPVFFPLNPLVIAVAGSSAAQLLVLKPVLQGHLVLQSDVDVSVLGDGEALTCLAWLPDGSLLLGTSLSRVLHVRAAAPPAVPPPSYGTGAAPHTACVVFTPPDFTAAAASAAAVGARVGATAPTTPASPTALAQAQGSRARALLAAPSLQPGSVLSLMPLEQLVVAVMAGGDALPGLLPSAPCTPPARLMWLAAAKPGCLQLRAQYDLPAYGLRCAAQSPDRDRLVLVSQRGELLLAEGVGCPAPLMLQLHGAGGSGAAGSGAGGSGAGGSGAGGGGGGGGGEHAGQQQRGGGGPPRQGQHLMWQELAEDAGEQEGGHAGGPHPRSAFAHAPRQQQLVLSGPPAALVDVRRVIRVTSVGRHHVGPVSGVVLLQNDTFVTGGADGSVRLWRVQLADLPAAGAAGSSVAVTPGAHSARSSTSSMSSVLAAGKAAEAAAAGGGGGAGGAPAASSGAGGAAGGGAGVNSVTSAQLLAVWHLGAPVTCLAAYRLTALVLVGTEDGCLRMFNTELVRQYVSQASVAASTGTAVYHMPDEAGHDADRYRNPSPTSGADLGDQTAQPHSQLSRTAVDDPLLAKALATVWAQQPFHSVTAAAFSPDGIFLAIASAAAKQVAFYRMVGSSPNNTSHEVAMQLLGFYDLSQAPRLLTWAPRDAEARLPLVVVGTSNGELQVLVPPDSLGPPRREDARLPLGSCLVALLRAHSTVTAMVTLPAHDAEGEFWLFACCADKSLRRFRLPTEQHKAAARTAISQMSARTGAVPAPQVPTPAQTVQYEAALAVAATITASQHFQMPETEKPLDLNSPACHLALAASGKHMVASTLCGSTLLYSLPDMTPLRRWTLNAMAPVASPAWVGLGPSGLPSARPLPPQAPCAAAAMSRVLVTGGPDGVLQVLEVTMAAGVAKVRARQLAAAALGSTELQPRLSVSPQPGQQGPAGKAQPPGRGVAASVREAAPPGLGSAVPGAGLVLPVGLALTAAPPGPPPAAAAAPAAPAGLAAQASTASAPPPQAAPAADTAWVPSWKEARLANARHARARDFQAALDALNAKRAVWQQRLGELHARNAAADVAARLSPHELVVDRGLLQQLQAEGSQRVQATQAAARHQCQVLEVQRERMARELLGAVEVALDNIPCLPSHTPLTNFTAEDLKRWKDSEARVAQVPNMAIRRAARTTQAVFNKVSFLRQVEQEEWEGRPPEQRGLLVPLFRWRGRLAARFVVGSGSGSANQTPREGAGAQGGAGGQQDAEAEEEAEPLALAAGGEQEVLEGAVVRNGSCGLLYSPVQLHTNMRKASQAVLLQEEVRCLQRQFNMRWREVAAHRDTQVARLEERHTRIAEIQKELGAGAWDSGLRLSDQHHWLDGLAVSEQEVQVEKWVSPEERARLEAQQVEEAAQRKRAEADDARQRALREMMNATLDVTARDRRAQELVHEPWMDLPRSQMTAVQRKLLAEHEKRAQELAEEREQKRRQLEVERKALEVECGDITAEFNAQLAALQAMRIKVQIEVLSLELHAVTCAAGVELSRNASQCQARTAQQCDVLRARSARVRSLCAEVAKVVRAAAKYYETLAGLERALDKALRRELSGRDEDIWEAAQRVYRDRSRALSGAPLRSVAELLGRSQEGQGAGSPTAASPQGTSPAPSAQPNEAALLLNSPASPEPSQPPPGPLLAVTRWLKGMLPPPHNQAPPSQGQADAHVELLLPPGGCQPGVQGGEVEGQPGWRPDAGPGAHQGLQGGGTSGGGSQPAVPPARSRRAGRAASMGAAQRMAGSQVVGDVDAPVQSLLARQQARRLELDTAACPALQDLQHLASARPLNTLLLNLAQGEATASAQELDMGPMGLAPPDLPSPHPSLFASPSAAAAFFADRQAALASSAAAATPPGCLPLSLAPYGADDRPSELEESRWQHLLELRDTRIALEQAADRAWAQLAWCSLTACQVEQEAAELGLEVEELKLLQPSLAALAQRAACDVLLTYRLSLGQVELPRAEAGHLAHMSDARLLHQRSVEGVNAIVLEKGGEQLALLQKLARLATAMHCAKWEVAAGDLRVAHARAALSDLQLLHATQELQAVLRDPSSLQRLEGGPRLQATLEAATRSHAQRMALKQRTLQQMTQKLALGLQAHEQLRVANSQAQAAYQESERLNSVVGRRRADEEAAHSRAMRAITTNVQLKDIAAQQASEIAALREQLERQKQRTFPALPPPPHASIPSKRYGSAADLAARFASLKQRPSTVAVMGAARPITRALVSGRPLSGSALGPALGRPLSGSNVDVGAPLVGTRPVRPQSVPEGGIRPSRQTIHHKAGNGSANGSTKGIHEQERENPLKPASQARAAW